MKEEQLGLEHWNENVQVAHYPDGALRQVACMAQGVCLAVLELDNSREEGEFRKAIAGERFMSGMIESLGPFAGTDPSYPAAMSFEEWARNKVEEIRQLALATASACNTGTKGSHNG